MAINDYTGTAPQPQVQQPVANPGSVPVQPANQQPRRSMSFMKIGSIGGLSRTPAAEILTKAMVALTEAYKAKTEKPWEVTLLAIDNSKETNLAFSGIAVCVRRTDALERGVAYHTLILEESGEMLTPRVESFRGAQYEIQRATCDAFDDLYNKAVFEIVLRAFPNTKMWKMDGEVVPRGFNFDDKEALSALALNAQLPCYTRMEVMDDFFQDMNLTAFDNDATLSVRISFNEPQKTDYANLPVRNDINISLTASSINRNQQSININTQDRTKSIASVGGYIDPIWAPSDNSQILYNPNIPQPKFAARFVITNMENVAQTTLPAQLLALTSASVLRENNNWFPYFSPRPMTSNSSGKNIREVDLRDIGAINIEGNMSNNPSGFDTYVDTKAALFTAQELGRLIQMTFRPGIHFSLRVSELGADTWYNSPFLAAAMNDGGAIRAILDAADTLTGKMFSQHYGTNESPVLINYDRVHMGYYTGADGLRHDISDIDYLAIMNMVGKKDNRAGAAWANTFLQEDMPIYLRLSARKKMIEDVISSEITYTGFARIVTFNSRFIDSLSKACAQAGLDMRTINPNISGDFFNQRAQAGFFNQVQMMPGSTGVFSQGYNNQQGGYQSPNIYQGRSVW